MKPILPVLSAALLCLASAATPGFQSGDRWCAVGDSITHTGRYHDYIYLFQSTRHPKSVIGFHNCGIAGDTAAGALKRAQGDILRHQPTVATILFGMNDVGRNLYADAEETPGLRQLRENKLNEYSSNMRGLAETLRASGARLIFITPTIYDETCALPSAKLPGVNAALGRCADEVRRLARDFNGTLVDFHGPMTELNRKLQKADPNQSLVGPDRIHPGETGHFVMAYLFLKAQGETPVVAEITRDAGGGSEVSFTHLEEALPFPVPEACLPALELVPFMDELNRETLRITGLPAGNYQLRIDGEWISTHKAPELAEGVNLATLPNTPQYRQALAVANLNERRFRLTKELRIIAYVESKMGRPFGDTSAFDHVAALEKIKTNHPWISGQYREYLRLKPQQAELENQLAACVLEIRKSSQPVPHQFLIQPIDPHETNH
jgi:lysophospholipase L1-like esterase